MVLTRTFHYLMKFFLPSMDLSSQGSLEDFHRRDFVAILFCYPQSLVVHVLFMTRR